MSDLTNFTVGALMSAIETSENENSDFNAKEEYVLATLVNLEPSLGERTTTKGVVVPTGRISFEVNGTTHNRWIDDSGVSNVTLDDIGGSVMIGYITFKAANDYEKGGIKKGDDNVMIRSLKRAKALVINEALNFEEKAQIMANACKTAGIPMNVVS